MFCRKVAQLLYPKLPPNQVSAWTDVRKFRECGETPFEAEYGTVYSLSETLMLAAIRINNAASAFGLAQGLVEVPLRLLR
jgi:hypothetical protein